MSEKARTVEDKFKDFLNSNAQGIFIYLTVLALIIFFREDISEYVGCYLQDSKSFKKIGIIDKSVFLLLFVLVSAWIIIKKINGYIFSLNRFWIYTYFILIYSIFRLSGVFPVNLEITESCAIILPDLLALVYAVLAWANVRNIVELFEENVNDGKPHEQYGFLADTPPTLEERQKLWSQEYVESFVKNLYNTDTKNTSFNVLLNSEWGTGKTTFIDEVEIAFQKNYGDNLIWVDFNAWKSENAQHIVADFFEQLEDVLSKEHTGAKRAIQKYLYKIDSSSAGWLGAIISMFRNNSLKTSREHLEDILYSIDKKIIIAVDDVDRLSSDEISEMMKLIRNTANFKDLFFIVACDKDYLNNAIKKINDSKYEKYTQKVFQLEINLPKYFQLKFEEIINDLITNLNLNSKDIEYIKSSRLSEQLVKQKLIENIRELKNIYNSTKLALNSIGNDINTLDYFLLEILKRNPSKAYNNIIENNHILDSYYIDREGLGFINTQNEYAMNIVKLNHDDFKSNDKIQFIFQALVRDGVDIKRIVHQESRIKYFTLGLGEVDFNTYQFEQLLHLYKSKDFEKNVKEYILSNHPFPANIIPTLLSNLETKTDYNDLYERLSDILLTTHINILHLYQTLWHLYEINEADRFNYIVNLIKNKDDNGKLFYLLGFIRFHSKYHVRIYDAKSFEYLFKIIFSSFNVLYANQNSENQKLNLLNLLYSQLHNFLNSTATPEGTKRVKISKLIVESIQIIAKFDLKIFFVFCISNDRQKLDLNKFLIFFKDLTQFSIFINDISKEDFEHKDYILKYYKRIVESENIYLPIEESLPNELLELVHQIPNLDKR